MVSEKESNYSDLAKIDRLIHEPSRMAIVAVLYGCESADFRFLLEATGLTKGNLSAHAQKLEQAEYVRIEKRFINKIPNTLFRLTTKGRNAFQAYRKQMRRIL
jgi:DNA-binding MarR family transcriptional regulator